MLCWAVKIGHVALMKSLADRFPSSVDSCFTQARIWFASKNTEHIAGKVHQIVDVSGVDLNFQRMTTHPDPSALFYFLVEACKRGDLSIVGMFLETMDKGGRATKPRHNNTAIFDLCCEYFMIEAAIHGHDALCQKLLPHCDLRAYTL
jgi:hypothetical protein